MNDKFLRESFDQIGIDLTDKQVSQLDRFYEMIIEKNKVMNLTKITDYDDTVTKHFVDSVSVVLLDDDIYIKNRFSEGASVIDVGNGAGFPGNPLKIVNIEIKLTFLDSAH